MSEINHLKIFTFNFIVLKIMETKSMGRHYRRGKGGISPRRTVHGNGFRPLAPVKLLVARFGAVQGNRFKDFEL